MIYLRMGDRLPAVGVLQRIINECRRRDARLSAVEALEEDGIFGPRTQAATIAVQRALGLQCRRGVIDPETWGALSAIGSYRIVDITDLALEARMAELGREGMRQILVDRFMLANPTRHRQQAELAAARTLQRFDAEIRACRQQHERFVSHGGSPIGITDVHDAFGAMRRGLEALSRDGSRIVLVRFTGHGSPASQGVAGSLIGAADITSDTLSFDEDDSPKELADTVALSGMSLPMAPFGCVELHGCNVGARRSVRRRGEVISLNGPAYVQSFANLILRPVSASAIGDSYGSLFLDTRYEGPVVSCVPGGGTVADWFYVH